MQRPTLSPQEQVRHLISVVPRLQGTPGLPEEVAVVLGEMDKGYAEVAAQVGFSCHGCEESCCRTVFYHHAYAEFLVLFQGLATLTGADRQTVYQRAAATQAALAVAGEGASGQPPRAMCPLNEEGRCALYAHRPMICRLHGVAHELARPDGHIISGPGCHRFDALCGGEPPHRLDRTPFYRRLARIEQRLRGHVEAPIRLHMTLAECLVAFAAEDGDAGFASKIMRTEHT